MKRIDASIVFAVRMLMVRYSLTPADMLKIMVAMEKDNDKKGCR